MIWEQCLGRQTKTKTRMYPPLRLPAGVLCSAMLIKRRSAVVALAGMIPPSGLGEGCKAGCRGTGRQSLAISLRHGAMATSPKVQCVLAGRNALARTPLAPSLDSNPGAARSTTCRPGRAMTASKTSGQQVQIPACDPKAPVAIFQSTDRGTL